MSSRALPRPVCLLVALGCLLVLVGPAGARGGPDPRDLHLKAASFDPLRGIPDLAGLDPVERYPEGVRGAYLVQFERPISAAHRGALEALGASVQGYLPMQTLTVVMTERERQAVETLPDVRWVGVYQAGYKLAPGLVRAQLLEPGRRMRLRVALFPGEQAAGRRQLEGLGAWVERLERGRSYALAEIEVPAARVPALARLPLVQHLDLVPERRELNDRARALSGLAAVADDGFASGLDPSLDGRDGSSGFQVKYGHTDGGLWSGHADFLAGVTSGAITFEAGADTADPGGHGTHTAGSIVGDGGQWANVPVVPPGSGAISQDRWRGVQPEAALHHISFENNYSDRRNFERHVEEGAQIATNSWGYVSCRGPVNCTPITDYDLSAAIWDDGVWDADDDASGQQPLIVFFSAGNDGSGGSNGCGSAGSDQISSPATAKNVITVGANETDRGCGPDGDSVEDVSYFSSRGPVDPDATGQGLFKPELTQVGGFWVLSTEAPGSGGSSLDSPFSCSDTGSSYRYEAGTSMACPLAAGLGGVVLQDLVVNRGVTAPTPSLVKALLVNGARGLAPSGGCDYTLETAAAEIHQGWGFVQAPASLYGPGGTPLQRNVHFENEESAHALATGESYQRTVSVPAGVPFKVTLAWTDYPASAGAGSPLVVNDLDLEVSGPEGLFHGNNFVGDESVPSTVQATPDRYNVVENVYIASTAGGSYTLSVRGFQVSQDQEPDQPGLEQDFSLVWSFPSLPECGDGLDNDADGAIDAPADPGCDDTQDASERKPGLACDDGLDNDGDGATDHPADPGCRDPGWSLEDPQCSDGLNNDPGQDGLVDFDGGVSAGLPPEALTDPDPQCFVGGLPSPWKNREKRRSCGLGFELVALALLLRQRRRG